jgi:hypothetical protein
VIKKERKVRQTLLAEEHTPGHPSTQFKSTPRFTFPSTPKPTATQSLPRATPAATRYLTPASKTPKEQDIIEGFSNEIPHDIHDSIETEDQEIDQKYFSAEGEDDDYKIEERVLKRRRISSLEPSDEEDNRQGEELPHHPSDTQDSVSSSLPILFSPPALRRSINTAAPRFLTSTLAPPAASQPSTPKQATFLKPPRFRPPDPSEIVQAASDPLPEQFSPHRRGQNYVPGGLAAQVRDWLVNIKSTIPSKEVGKRPDEAWLVRIVVDDVSGSSRVGMTLVKGRQIHSMDGEGVELVDRVGEVRVILAGGGGGTGFQKGSKLEIGKRIGIKGPVWEVVIEGTKWGVGVDWKVLA